MKTLYIVRHAKSDWGDEALRDIDRHLNPRGYSDAYFMSKLFMQHYTVPELMVSSPAIRAFSTALIFARTFKYPEHSIVIKEEIYEAGTDTLKQSILAFDNNKSSVMLFGHNPGLSNLFNEISDSCIDSLPTCAIVGISFDVKNWNEINKTEGKTLFTDFPKEFKP